MKLKDEFITHLDGNTQLMIDTSANFSGLVRSNQTASEIIELLKSETSEAEIIENMLNKYDVSEEILKQDVNDVLQKLRKIGAIRE